MIASTLLQDAVAKFLVNVSKYTGIPFFLLDQENTAVVRTTGADGAEYEGEIGNATERKIALRDGTVWHLYTTDPPLPGAELLREQVLDFAAEVIHFILINEEEMQNLANELLERYQELHVLYDVIKDVSTILNENDICTAVLRKAMQTLDVRSGAVVYADRNTEPEVHCKLEDAPCLVDEDLKLYASRVCKASSHITIARSHAVVDGVEVEVPSLLAVPIVVNNTAIGTMIVSAKRVDGDFTSGDRISLTALAGYLGIAITSAQLIREAHNADALRREFDFARKIQQSLLPKQLPAIPTLEIAARCIAATEVGGDLFTVLPLGTNEWAIGVADVAGHGLGSAFILASLRSILRSECRRDTRLEESIRISNELFCEDTMESELFATLLMTSYNDATRMMRVVNAGHPPGLLLRSADRSICELRQGGVAVGLFPDEVYAYDEFALEHGDVLALFTDGIIESRNGSGEFYGSERLASCLQRHAALGAEDILQHIFQDMGMFHDGISQNDDVTIVILKAR